MDSFFAEEIFEVKFRVFPDPHFTGQLEVHIPIRNKPFQESGRNLDNGRRGHHRQLKPLQKEVASRVEDILLRQSTDYELSLT